LLQNDGERCYIHHYATVIGQHPSYVLFRIYTVFNCYYVFVFLFVVVVVDVVVVDVDVRTICLKWKLKKKLETLSNTN
jgi:hypothetical protein